MTVNTKHLFRTKSKVTQSVLRLHTKSLTESKPPVCVCGWVSERECKNVHVRVSVWIICRWSVDSSTQRWPSLLSETSWRCNGLYSLVWISSFPSRSWEPQSTSPLRSPGPCYSVYTHREWKKQFNTPQRSHGQMYRRFLFCVLNHLR